MNDLLRAAIGFCIRKIGVLLSYVQDRRIRKFKLSGLRPDRRTDGRYALTSGSAGDPKRILYTSRRLRTVKLVFSDMFARACCAFRIKRTSLYVFSSFEPDESLTSLLLEEVDLPNYLTTLQAPYRVQRHAAMRALAAEYGPTAVRLWLLTIANPGVLYATNPSTISTFFDELTEHWREGSLLIRNWCEDDKRFNVDIRKIARRLNSTGSQQRLQTVAASDGPLPLAVWAPAVEAYICWTGGYVKPFLERLQQYLPPARYRLIPMYSMSTETLETSSYFANGDVFFLPLAPGVLFEFIDENDNFLGPTELQPGKLYEMVVSDGYGLRRYHTKDLFLCRRKIRTLPDLVFVRRSGLEYSFTGEKLTAEQCTIVFEQLRTQYPAVFANKYLTCVPSQSSHAIPHYKVLLVGERDKNIELDSLAACCDELLSQVNCEYRAKRASGRLGAVTFIVTGTREFAERFAAHRGWESQFKFLPLCPHLIWNDEKRVS
ncbi:MAG: GH3 auxin-responsive promoter family protein [Acidobacteria bacterium]|nr:GH3 auxin-responsive promoter family protein [Acidobacteriota bacterium]